MLLHWEAVEPVRFGTAELENCLWNSLWARPYKVGENGVADQ